MRPYVLPAVWVLALLRRAMAADADFHRAHTPLPRRHLTASNFESRSRIFNDVLSRHEIVQTRPCEEHSLDEMIVVRDLLVAAANADLNRIYESSNDRRRLSLSSASPAFVPRDPHLAVIMRDALCVESTNLYTHHLLEEEKVEFGALSTLPLFPVSEHTRGGTQRKLYTEDFLGVMPSGANAEEFEDTFAKYEEANICNLCHDILTDDNIVIPLAPRWPDEFKTSIYKRDPQETMPDELTLRQYSWPLRSSRDDTIFDDGSNRMVIDIRTGCRDQYTDDGELIPGTQECYVPDPAIGRPPQSAVYYIYETDGTHEQCTATDSGFGMSPPFWMQIGGGEQFGCPVEEDLAFRDEDVVVNGILCEVWNRQKPGTLDDHKVYWDRANEVPVRRESEGGPREVSQKDYSNFQRDAEIDPAVFRPPRICLTVPVDYIDYPCINNLPPEEQVPTQTQCPPLRPPSPGPLQHLNLNSAGGAERAEVSGVGAAGVAGLTVAGALFVAVGVAAARRFTKKQGGALRGSQLMNPVLDWDAGANQYEMGNSSSSVSGGVATA